MWVDAQNLMAEEYYWTKYYFEGHYNWSIIDRMEDTSDMSFEAWL